MTKGAAAAVSSRRTPKEVMSLERAKEGAHKGHLQVFLQEWRVSGTD